MKKLLTLLIVSIILITVGCSSKNNINNESITASVSIVPQKTFVEHVGKEHVFVEAIIPPGSSPANYQPSPKEMNILSNADIYFSIGVPAEVNNIISKIDEFNENLTVVKLHEKSDSKYEPRYFSAKTRDPHIWLSPKRVIVMVESIRDELIKLDPENTEDYKKNAKEYIEKLQDLDKELSFDLSNIENKKFIITHPALGYFADDYGLEMFALEEDGKTTAPAMMEKIIKLAKDNNIDIVFYQAEFSSSQAETIATEIGGKAIEIKTLSSDYINNLIDIKNIFVAELN